MKLEHIFTHTDWCKFFTIKQRLNPKFWTGFDLKVVVQNKVLKIVNEFIEKNELGEHVYDIVLMGSMCDTIYTNKSDVDVHIVLNVQETSDVFVAVKNACRLFNMERNIYIYNHKVEINPQTKKLTDTSKNAAIYSVAKKKWIRRPVEHELSQETRKEINTMCNTMMNRIHKATKAKSIAQLKKIANELKEERKSSVAKEGELAVYNIMFKCLRNKSIIDELYMLIDELEDKKLSLK